MRTSILVAALVLATALTGGCSANAPAVARGLGTGKPVGKAPTPAPSRNPSVVVPDTLKFTGTTLDGQSFDATALAGKPVILWFWAPWCAVCLGQGQSVTDLAQQYSGRVNLLGVAGLDQSTKNMKEFVSQADVGNVTHLNDKDGVLWKRFGIKEQSTFVLINRSGKVMATTYLDSVTLDDWASYLVRH
jgi:thiol-disulfide isomerase/thioredoxin